MTSEPRHEPRQPLAEFKKFALKGNLIDLALAVVIGSAFNKVVEGLVKLIIMPALSYLTGRGQPGEQGLHPLDDRSDRDRRVSRRAGQFSGHRAVLFLFFVKLLGTLQASVPSRTPPTPTTKECPYCLSVVPFKASKCAHCTSDLPAGPRGDCRIA